MICEFCRSRFTKQKNMLAHQRTAEYCLEIQRLKNNICEYCRDEVKQFEIHYCHQKIIMSLQKQNEELKEIINKQNEELKQKDKLIQDIVIKSVSTPKTIIKNTTNNKYEFLAPFDLTSDYVKSKVSESFTEEYFLKGQKGVANFSYENLLIHEISGKQNYYCTDLSRKIFVYRKEGSDKVIKDYKLNNLTNMISTDIIDKSQSIYEDGLRRIKKTKNSDSDLFDKTLVYFNNLCDIKSMKTNNDRFVLKLCELVCNINNDNEDDEIEYIIEDDSEEEEDLSKYTKEYFENKEALIDKFRDNKMYKTFLANFEAEKLKYLRDS